MTDTKIVLKPGDTLSVSVPAVVPVPPPPPITLPGIPTIDPALGKDFRWEGKNGTLAPFVKITWLDDHIGQSGQYMTQFCRFSNATPTVHDGYLDLRATKRGDGLWDAMMVGTGAGFGYGTFRFWLSFNIGVAVWQAAWLYDIFNWSSTEIDFPEMLENQSLTGNVLGQSEGHTTSGTKPADLATVFHEFKIERRASFVAFSIDGKEVGRVNGSMPSTKLAILLDACVGHGWMGPSGGITSATPNPVFLHVAGVTVDA